MIRYLILAIFLFLMTSVICCSGSKAAAPEKEKESGASDTASTAKETGSVEELNDFPENVFKDMKTSFEDSQITLASLQRNDKGTTLKAVISESDAETLVPRAMKIIGDNFASLEKVIVKAGDGQEYSISGKKLGELMTNTNEEGSLYSALWKEVNTKMQASSGELEKDQPVQKAGM